MLMIIFYSVSVLSILFNMYRLVILSIVGITALAADLDKKSCVRMFHPHSMHCCKKSDEAKEKMMNDDLKECFQLPKDPVTCEHEVCIAKKRGFATDDGNLDTKKLEEVVTKDIDDKDLLADVKANCIHGDLEQYGPPEFCDFIKMRQCISMQVLNHCPEWNEFGDCNQLKGAVAECVKLVNS